MKRGGSLSLKRGDSIRIPQKQPPVVLPQLKLIQPALVQISLNLRTRGVAPSFATFAASQDTGNVTAVNVLSLKALAVAHTLVNPLIPLIKLVLRQYKPRLLPILKQSPRYRILCPYSIRHLTRVIAFVQSESRMRVAAPTTLKSSCRVYSLKALLIAAPILPLWVLAYFRKLLLLTG